MKVLENKVNS